MRHCSVAHFACHGKVDSDPPKSCILFSDWESIPFSVFDMTSEKFDRAELAYISACHAANSRNLALLNKAIHTAGACQLAGVPTFIGISWQIPDVHSARIAKDVYLAMLTGNRLDIRKAERGLHFAVRKIRDESLERNGSEHLIIPCNIYI